MAFNNITDDFSLDPWLPLRHHVVQVSKERLKDHGVEVRSVDILKDLAQPPEGMGDVALPLFRYAKSANLSPQELGLRMAEGFPCGETISQVASSGGFLNFRVDFPWLFGMTLRSVTTLGDSYGRSGRVRGTACVEHTSANPTGQLHVGRSRNSIVGDTYARVLKAAGFSVCVHFYVDDIGRQAATLAWMWSKPVESWAESVRQKSEIEPGARKPNGMKPDEWRGKPYPSASELIKNDPQALKEVSDFVARFERGEMPRDEYRRIPHDILEGMVSTLKRIGVTFDDFVWESDFILDGDVKDVLERLASSKHAVRDGNGALAMDLSSYGLPKELEKVYLTRSDGSSLYVARDVAYHEQKLKEFDRVIDVLGEDHKNHFRTLEAMLTEEGVRKRPEVLHYSFVGLPEGKMSTRSGRAVTLDSLLNEARERARKEVLARRPDAAEKDIDSIAEKVGSGAVRFHLLSIQPDKPIVFKWEEALSFDGKSGPFVQYSHARASSLLRKAEAEGWKKRLQVLRSGTMDPPELPGTPDPREEALLKTLSRLPTLVERVSVNGSVHLIALYAHEAAERFNEFYQAVRVLGGEEDWVPFRLSLVHATKQVLHNALDLMGVEPLESM